MKNGEKKAIETIELGDEVMSYSVPSLKGDKFDWQSSSIADNSFTSGKVLFVHRGSEVFHYVINGNIRASYEHPFFVKIGQVWRYVEAQNLKKGYIMLKSSGEEVQIETIEIINGRVETFNLKVETYAHFIAEDVVVHNADGTPGTKTIINQSGGSQASGFFLGGGEEL